MVSVYAADSLPAPSLYCTYTLLVPGFLPESLQLYVPGVNEIQEDHLMPLLEARTCETPLPGEGSVAFKVSLTESPLVRAAPLLMSTLPVGAVVSAGGGELVTVA